MSLQNFRNDLPHNRATFVIRTDSDARMSFCGPANERGSEVTASEKRSGGDERGEEDTTDGIDNSKYRVLKYIQAESGGSDQAFRNGYRNLIPFNLHVAKILSYMYPRNYCRCCRNTINLNVSLTASFENSTSSQK